MKVLIVGCGVTGGLVRHFLSKELCKLPIGQNHRITYDIWEIESYLGGRMKSYHFQQDHQRYEIDMVCDNPYYGAQYITQHPECENILDELVQQNLLYPFPGLIDGMNSTRFNSTNYINPNGLDRIIEFYTRDSTKFFLKGLSDLTYDSMTSKWIATCTSGSINIYEGIVLTIPAPKILELQGNYQNYLPDSFVDRLKSVQYSSRFALSLFFSKVAMNSIPWTSQYVRDDMIRYISRENKKRQILDDDPQEIQTILIHTSIPFYHQMKEESDEVIIQTILDRLFLLLPTLQSKETILESSHLHRWDLSQVVPSTPTSLQLDNIDGGSLSCDFLATDHSLLRTQSQSETTFSFLGMAGDYFTESNFNGCSKSALDLVKKIVAISQQLVDVSNERDIAP